MSKEKQLEKLLEIQFNSNKNHIKPLNLTSEIKRLTKELKSNK